MFAGLPSLTHEQQQKAVERIQELMAQGMSSGQAIALVAEELRANHSGERIVARFEDEDEYFAHVWQTMQACIDANHSGERIVARFEDEDE